MMVSAIDNTIVERKIKKEKPYLQDALIISYGRFVNCIPHLPGTENIALPGVADKSSQKMLPKPSSEQPQLLDCGEKPRSKPVFDEKSPNMLASFIPNTMILRSITVFEEPTDEDHKLLETKLKEKLTSQIVELLFSVKISNILDGVHKLRALKQVDSGSCLLLIQMVYLKSYDSRNQNLIKGFLELMESIWYWSNKFYFVFNTAFETRAVISALLQLFLGLRQDKDGLLVKWLQLLNENYSAKTIIEVLKKIQDSDGKECILKILEKSIEPAGKMLKFSCQDMVVIFRLAKDFPVLTHEVINLIYYGAYHEEMRNSDVCKMIISDSQLSKAKNDQLDFESSMKKIESRENSSDQQKIENLEKKLLEIDIKMPDPNDPQIEYSQIKNVTKFIKYAKRLAFDKNIAKYGTTLNSFLCFEKIILCNTQLDQLKKTSLRFDCDGETISAADFQLKLQTIIKALIENINTEFFLKSLFAICANIEGIADRQSYKNEGLKAVRFLLGKLEDRIKANPEIISCRAIFEIMNATILKSKFSKSAVDQIHFANFLKTVNIIYPSEFKNVVSILPKDNIFMNAIVEAMGSESSSSPHLDVTAENNTVFVAGKPNELQIKKPNEDDEMKMPAAFKSPFDKLNKFRAIAAENRRQSNAKTSVVQFKTQQSDNQASEESNPPNSSNFTQFAQKTMERQNRPSQLEAADHAAISVPANNQVLQPSLTISLSEAKDNKELEFDNKIDEMLKLMQTGKFSLENIQNLFEAQNKK